MTEEWKDILGYEGKYQVSNNGRVKSKSRSFHTFRGVVIPVHEKILKPHVGKNGYLTVHFWGPEKNKARTIYVHHLVANAFIPNPDNLPQINHIDANRANSTLTNLERCTASHNSLHAFKLKTRVPCRSRLGRYNKDTKMAKPVLQLSVKGDVIMKWPSCSEPGRQGFQKSSVSRCCLGKQHTHRGFKWKYE